MTFKDDYTIEELKEPGKIVLTNEGYALVDAIENLTKAIKAGRKNK